MNIYQKIFDNVRKLKEKILVIIALDIIFLFFYGFIKQGIFSKIAEYLYAIQVSTTVNAQNLNSIESLTSGLSNPVYSTNIQKIILLLFLFYLLIYFIYVIIEGMAWWFTYFYSGKKIDKGYFLKKFGLINLPLIFFLIVDNLFRFIYGFRTIKTLDAPLYWDILMVVIVFFIFISYSALDKKHIFRYTLKNFSDKLNVIPVILIIFILNYLTIIYPALMIPFGVFLILPGFVYIRMLLLE